MHTVGRGHDEWGELGARVDLGGAACAGRKNRACVGGGWGGVCVCWRRDGGVCARTRVSWGGGGVSAGALAAPGCGVFTHPPPPSHRPVPPNNGPFVAPTLARCCSRWDVTRGTGRCLMYSTHYPAPLQWRGEMLPAVARRDASRGRTRIAPPPSTGVHALPAALAPSPLVSGQMAKKRTLARGLGGKPEIDRVSAWRQNGGGRIESVE